MNLLAQASNTTPQQIVAILNTTLSVDGIYTVAVNRLQPTTLEYLVTVQDITSNSQSLVFNQHSDWGKSRRPTAATNGICRAYPAGN